MSQRRRKEASSLIEQNLFAGTHPLSGHINPYCIEKVKKKEGVNAEMYLPITITLFILNNKR